MTELPGADAALAATPGAALATAREANGLSIAQVAEQMRISPRQVEAIEADRYGELPGAVFVRGFVRNYARVLKLDPVPLLHALEPALGGDVPLRAHEIAGTLPETTRRGHGRLWLGVIVVVVAAAALAAAYEWWRGRVPAVGGSIGSVAPGKTPSAPQLPAPEATAPAQATVPLSPERVTDSPTQPAAEATQSSEAAGGVASPPPAATPQGPGDMSQGSTAAPQGPATAPQSPAARDASVGM
ncbi:MAG: helix-turn-helix domain-containing protein, partial [Burkholderiales bacterium]